MKGSVRMRCGEKVCEGKCADEVWERECGEGVEGDDERV